MKQIKHYNSPEQTIKHNVGNKTPDLITKTHQLNQKQREMQDNHPS